MVAETYNQVISILLAVILEIFSCFILGVIFQHFFVFWV